MNSIGRVLRSFVFLIVAGLCLLSSGTAFASVELAFYSKELGVTFPHAFVTLKGTLDETGQPVDEAFGFTAKSVTPAILMGSVSGEIIAEQQPYIEKSDRQFSVPLSDDQYRAVRAVVEEWRNRKQPSYNLNRRNCIHFVAAIAEAVGLKVEYPKALMKRPRSFLEAVREANAAEIAARAAAPIPTPAIAATTVTAP